MDIIEQLGELAIGSRLKRLSDYLMMDGQQIYKDYRVDFLPSWFPVFYLLSQEKGKMSIMEIAKKLNTAHPTIIKITKQLEKKEYISSKKDELDGRKRFLFLSPKGKKLLPQLQLIWKDIAEGLSELLRSQNHNLLNAIAEVESKFEEKKFSERVKNIREKRMLEAIQILDYQTQYGTYFKSINYAWIEHYFKVEPIDAEALDNHQSKILDKGGAIIFAQLEEKIVGTCALINFGNGEYELAKMGVDEKYRGLKIGKKLGFAIIEKAKELGAKKIILESNKQLNTALNLYLSLGFKLLATTNSLSDYERCDVRMEMIL